MNDENSSQRPFKQARAAALRSGLLLDITHAARAAEFGMPASITPRLWQAIAGEAAFHSADPRIVILCWCLFLMLRGKCCSRQKLNAYSRTVWFDARIWERTVQVKAMAHAGDDGEPVMTLMTPEEGCEFVK
jgi:hypothetical protein